MVPTYFRRELRDRVLQRPLRLRTIFVACGVCRFPRVRHTPSPGLAIGSPDDRLQRGVQYAAASQFDHERLLNTGSPAFAGDDGRTRHCMTATLSKADLRAAALAKRDALSDEQRAAAAQGLAKRGLPVAITPGMVVSAYSPIRNEIDPVPLMRKLAEQGAKLALPAVLARGKSLAFRAWSPDDRLMLGPLGIPEPSPAAAEMIPDVMLIPLAAFDRQGHRIGYGAGHYDYTLAHLRKVKAIAAVGIAFAVQEIKAVPALPHDVALDYVLTEKKMFDFRS
jgi:5-formyltetrahydrofolate cyclo-ligase